MLRRLKNISKFDTKKNREKTMINVREDQELSYNMVSVKELLSDSVNNGQGDVYQEYIEEVKANKSFNRSFLNTFKRKSMNRINPLKTTKRKILSLLKKGKDDKDKIHKGSKSMLEDVDTSNQCIPDRNSKTCSLIEPSNDQITNNSIIDNSQYLFIKKKIQNKNNELLANDVSSLSQSLISNNELESIVPLPPSETQFQSSNKIHQKQFSQLNKSDQFYQIKHENNSPTNECKSSLITPPTTPVQTPINQPVVISPLTPESISNSHKDDNNNNNNKQISDSSNMPSSCKSSPKSMVSKSPKTTNQIINETSTEYKTLINLNKDTPPTPEYKSSSTIENKPRKLQKHKKIANNVKKFIKKALSPFSHQNNNLEEKIHIATVDYTTSLSDETDKTNTIDNELMSLSIKKGKRKKEENDILTSSSLSSKNLTSSPENMDSFEDDNLRKTHKINKYNSANNWNSALGQYILKMKKGDKPKKKMSKKSSSSLSNVISIGSKNVSSVLSSSSSTSSSISSTITKNNMTLAATIDSDTIKTNSKNESENDNKRYAFIFDKQKVRQEFEKVKNKENIKKENPKLTSVKKIESKSTLSGSYIDESSGIRMKLDKSEHIELQETEEDKYIESNKPKTELETWNEEDIKSNPLNNTTTEVIEIVEEDDINDNETEDWNTVSESEFDYNSNSNKKKETVNEKNDKLLNNNSTTQLVDRKKKDFAMITTSSFVSGTSQNSDKSETLSLRNINEPSMDTSLTTSIYKSSPFIESYMNSGTSSHLDNEKINNDIVNSMNEDSINDESAINNKSDANVEIMYSSIPTEVIKINEDIHSSISSEEEVKNNKKSKMKLLAEAVNLYKKSICNEQPSPSIPSYLTLSSTSNIKLPNSPINSLEDDETESKDENDDDNSSVYAVVDEPMSSKSYSAGSTEDPHVLESPYLNPHNDTIDPSDLSLSNRRSSNTNSITTSHFTHSDNNRRSRESLNTSHSSRIPTLTNKTSSLGATPSMISMSSATITTSNPSSRFSNIPELVTDISGYASSSIPIRSSISVPTTVSTTSSDAYSTLLSSDIPKMPSNVSIGIIGGNSDNQRITSYIGKSLDTRRYSSSRDDDNDNIYNSSFNDIDINQSSIPNTGLIQKMEFSPLDDSSTSNTGSSYLYPPKINYESPTVLNNGRPPLPPKDSIYKNNIFIYPLDNEVDNINNEDTSYYDSSYTSNETSFCNYNEDICKLDTHKKRNGLLQIIKRKDDHAKSVYSGSSLLVINDPKEKSNNAISKFYSEKEIEQIENKDNNLLNISKEFTFNNDEITNEDTSYVIKDVRPTFIAKIEGEYNVSNIKNDDSNYLIKSKSYSYKEYGEDTRRDMIYEFCRMLSKKYDKENMLEDISSNFDDDNSTTLNPRQENSNKYIDFSFEPPTTKLLDNDDFHDNKYLDNSLVFTSYHINLPMINLPPPLSPKNSNKIEKLTMPTQPLWKVEDDIIRKESHMEYNKPFNEDQNCFSNLNSNYYSPSSPVKSKNLSYHPKIKYKIDDASNISTNSDSSSCDTCSCSNCSSCQNESKEYRRMERKNHGYSGIMEKSISNIEEYNKSKNEIIVDQDIIDEVFTEKSKNDISSTTSYYSVSRSSFDDVGFDFFHNEYNSIYSSGDNYNALIGASEKLKFYYLDAADIYGINSNLRNNSDIPVISSSSFKNPDFLLGSVNTIHAYIDYNELKYNNSFINDKMNRINNHYYVPDTVEVVLKVMKPETDKQKLKTNVKLINEWVCLQRFNPIYGISSYFNEDVVVTQFYKNGSLGQYLTNNSSISFEEKEEFIVEIVEGLNICHSHDIVHGNLKPSNILLDEYYHALLSDFSMSHMSPSSPSEIQRQWLAPEFKQHSGPLTSASDIYSLGLVIYYIFNDGIRYFPNNSKNSDFLDKDWPKNILTILEHCLQENPNDRWTIKEILNHLKMHYQFGSIADKYLNRKSSNRIFTGNDSKSKSRFGQDTDPSYYNRYPKLERFKKFNRYNQYYHHDDNSNKDLQFALKVLKNSLYYSDWNYTQAMKLMTGSKDVPCNIPKAIQRLVIPCSEGHVDSLLKLGLCYFDGQGVARNTTKAYNLWKIAVEIFPNRHVLGGKYQQINKNILTKINNASPSSNYMKFSSGTQNNGSIISPPHTPIQSNTPTLNQNITPCSKNTPPSINIKSPIATKSLYAHNNSSSYSFDSLLQKKQNLRGFTKCNERTFDLWKEVAERKYTPAYVILGQCYRDGILVESDIAKALIWFKRAAHMNDINGCWYLALCYFIYYDNYQDAFTWLLNASKKKHSEADTALGLFYYYGLGIPRNVNQALDHFQYAADLGNTNAQYLYCECLNYIFKEKENQMPKSITMEEKSIHYDKLFHYCSMAATQGNPRAQFLLGKLYLDGSLKFINTETSNYKFNSSIGLQWIRLSAENGYKKAKEFLIEIL